MAKLLVLIAATQAALGAGVTFDHIQVDVVDGAGTKQSVNIDGITLNTSFDNVAEGDGTVSATAIDSTGAPLADAVTATFNVPPVTPPTPGTFPQPVSVSITIG